jgi:D-glycero-alpha-D-manno-heptose 1-phosphate guanylyltransferase
LRFEEKQQNPGPGWVNAGLYLINRKLLNTIPSNGPCSLEREIFPMWIGKPLYGCCGDGQFVDIGTPESYARAETFFLRSHEA